MTMAEVQFDMIELRKKLGGSVNHELDNIERSAAVFWRNRDMPKFEGVGRRIHRLAVRARSGEALTLKDVRGV